MTATMTRKQIEARIREIEATSGDDLCVGHDEGTHRATYTYSVYESLTGERSAVRRDGGVASRASVKAAEEGTAGRIRYSQDAIARIGGLRAELKRLREILRKMKK